MLLLLIYFIMNAAWRRLEKDMIGYSNKLNAVFYLYFRQEKMDMKFTHRENLILMFI